MSAEIGKLDVDKITPRRTNKLQLNSAILLFIAV